MNLFKFKKSQPVKPALPPIEKMAEVEQKLVKSLRDKPLEWRITSKTHGDNEEWWITHSPSLVRIMIPERVARIAALSNTVVGDVTYDGYYFHSEFIKVFGALAYARWKTQDAEDKRLKSERALKDLKERVTSWK